MNSERVVELLARAPLFAGLRGDALTALAGLANPRQFRKGQVLFYADDPSDALYLLAEGTIKVFVTSGRGDELVLATLRPPETLGEVSLLDDGPRSACAEALDDVTALAFARSAVMDLAMTHRAVLDALMRSAGVLLRRTTTHTADFVFLDLEGRVAKLLVEMAEARGVPTDEGVQLELGLTQADLASMVGGSRQSVNQILHALAGRGFVALESGSVTILDHEALQRRAGLA